MGLAGVWPLVVALALATFAVLCFPDGRLPSPRWRSVVAVVIAITVSAPPLSALWPVEYASAGVITHPSDQRRRARRGRDRCGRPSPTRRTPRSSCCGWSPSSLRWRSSDGHVRRQLAWLVAAAAVSVVASWSGLAVWGTPVPG